MHVNMKIFEVSLVAGRTQVVKTIESRELGGRDREELKAKACRRAQELGLTVRSCNWTATDPPAIVLYATTAVLQPQAIPGWRHKIPPQ